MPELIYCAAGNKRFAEIAIKAGFTYGACLPNTVYFDPQFADQNWKKPRRKRYMEALAKYRPRLATALDWEREEQLAEVLDWAEEATQYVEVVIIIPKVVNGITKLPRVINGKQVRLGYSAATTFASTSVPMWQFVGWPVHCLGGSPHQQMRLARYLDVQSCDGNYAQGMAVKRCQYFSHKPMLNVKNRHWPQIKNTGDGNSYDAPYQAFALSCENIRIAWQQLYSEVA